jgi:phospholipid transport system substrate-binding protein
MLRRLALALTLALVPAAVPVLATPAAAQPAKAGPGTTAVKQANETIAGLIKKKAAAAEVTKSVRAILDIDQLGKTAMVNQWGKLKAAEQTEFLTVLRELIEANYVNIQKANAEYTTEYTGETTNATGNIVVNTKVKAQRKGRPFTLAIDYVLVKNGATLQVFDVITDGVGLVTNYQQMFDKVIKDKGFTGLIAKMKTKLEDIRKQSAAPTKT